MDEPKRNLKRSELHELIWSIPIGELARQYGITERALSRICAYHLVPVPPSSYWIKLRAGQPVKQTKLRPVENDALQSVFIGQKASPPRSQYLETTLANVAAAPLRETKEKSKEARPKLAPVLADVVEKPAIDKSSPAIHPKARELVSEFRSVQVDRDGFQYFKGIKVPPSALSRVGQLLSKLVYQLEPAGFELDWTSDRLFGFRKDGVTVGFYLNAPRKRSFQESSYGWRSPRYEHIGRLELSMWGVGEGKRVWIDADHKKVEDSLPQIVERLHSGWESANAENERRLAAEKRRAHLTRRRELASQRDIREKQRSSYFRSIEDAKREAKEIRSAIEDIVLGDTQRPETLRMVEWAKARLARLEEELTAEGIQSYLVEHGLFPDPDPLHDPEGDPPAKVNSWDD